MARPVLALLAATVRLPYAAAIRAGAKPIENRGKPIAERHIGQPIAIHAAAQWSKMGESDMRIRRWWWGPERAATHPFDATLFSNMFRKVVAVATVAGCHEAVWPLNEDLTCCQPFGDRRYGPRGEPAWHIELDDIASLDVPVGPVRGWLNIPWTLPEDITRQVVEQVPDYFARFEQAGTAAR